MDTVHVHYNTPVGKTSLIKAHVPVVSLHHLAIQFPRLATRSFHSHTDTVTRQISQQQINSSPAHTLTYTYIHSIGLQVYSMNSLLLL